MANRPVIKAEIPATIPARIIPSAGIGLDDEFINDEPVATNMGIAMMSHTDHVPKVVSGLILHDRFVISHLHFSQSLLGENHAHLMWQLRQSALSTLLKTRKCGMVEYRLWQDTHPTFPSGKIISKGRKILGLRSGFLVMA
jgi:hypothetical protein